MLFRFLKGAIYAKFKVKKKNENQQKALRRSVGRLTNLGLALSFILTVVSTGQKSSELLFTLTLGSYYRRTETLFKKRNTEHQ